MKRDTVRRLASLEDRIVCRQGSPSQVFITHPYEAEEQWAMEKPLVLDYYRHDGLLIQARERPSSGPGDRGLRCPNQGHLPLVIRELHQDCVWRTRDGECHTCAGTDVAGS